ncbi:histidine kinase [Campylobacterota bacterium]|nr:histidine kinase [Campylobacterota bacterium]
MTGLFLQPLKNKIIALALFLSIAALVAVTYNSVRLIDELLEARYQEQISILARAYAPALQPALAIGDGAKIQDMLAAWDAPETVFMVVTDPNGRILAASGRSVEDGIPTINENATLGEVRTTMLPVQLGATTYGYLYLALQTSYATDIQKKLIIQDGAIAAVGIVALLIALTSLSLCLSRGLSKLVQKSAKVAQGNYDERLSIQGADELATLEHNFNTMFNALQNALVSAKEAQSAKDTFLATMSHEIRTPLNAILGFAELLLEEIKEPEHIRYLDTIYNNGWMLLETINDVLDFAKIKSGKMKVDMQPSVLQKDISGTVELFITNAASKNITLSEEWDERFPECIITDNMLVRQILSNLLSNAVKFTPNDKTIVLRALYHEAEGTIEFAVQDEGIGISQEWLEKVFDEFTQVLDSDAARRGGTGLGLSISMNLARLLGGILSAQSVAGSGSIFSLTLPATLCKIGHDGGGGGGETASETMQFNGNRRKILVAEDQADNQLLIRLLLERLGFSVTIVDDGKQAVEQFTSGEQFHAVLLDENMPVMSGSQALKAIREFEECSIGVGKRTPIAALTANAVKGDREQFISSGFDDYLSKPIIKQDLILLLIRLLGE